MEELEHSLYIVELFNKIFSKPLSLLLGLMGIEVKNPEHLVPDYIVMCLIVAAFLILFFGLSSRKLKLVPSKLQSILELIIEAFDSLLVDTIGEKGKKYLPMVATVGLFILSCNLLGLVPGLMSPTSKLNVTVGCALTVFTYYHWQGIKSQGVFKYLKHFMGPIPLIAPLMVPIEIISHFSRPVSLSIRLFGNIFAEELLIVITVSIIPFFLPLPFMAVAIFTAVIQAFVFVLLSCIYIAGAVAHEEEH
ncbi:MAG: F0F1 ATP synthase subunit A [Candidatus Aminicenantes bacterium]|nr:MAG: F0F1 ATP synthase subunit A [Candidatus Aminicenantes bacterium]